MIQAIPVKETRDRLADLINQVDIAGAEFIITKFGKPKAMLVPISTYKKKKMSGISQSFGAWKGRKDIQDTNKWVQGLRVKMSKRHE